MSTILFDDLRTAVISFLFFFNDTATTEIYTLSLHDALPICRITATEPLPHIKIGKYVRFDRRALEAFLERCQARSEEHTSELQSRQYLVCRLLLEKKKNITDIVVCVHKPLTSSNAIISSDIF